MPACGKTLWMVLPNIAHSAELTIVLQARYPPTMMTMVTKGPMLARVYCGSPPVMLGISELSSETDKANRMLMTQAITIEMMNVVPIAEAPCPRESRQLVATIRPTPVATTLPMPSFLLAAKRIHFLLLSIH